MLVRLFIYLWLTVCISICGSLKATPMVADTIKLPDMGRLYDSLESLKAAGNYAVIARNLFTANRDLRSSELYLYTALYYSKADLPDSAAISIALALDNGMANPKILAMHKELNIVKQSGRWKEIDRELNALNKQLSEFERFEIDTSPMESFGKYFRAAQRDTARAREMLREYIASGSPAVRDYYTIRYGSIEDMFQQMIRNSPMRYQQTQQVFAISSFDTIKQETVGMMRTFSELYEPAVFPKVYIVSGLNNSGGTATNLGLFVGGEKFVKPIDTSREQLNQQQLDSMSSFEGMQSLIMHELMHFQQNYQDDENGDKVIGKIIREGVCDFLVELCSGESRKDSNIAYLDQSENMEFILAELEKDLYATDLSNWMYNGAIEDRPVDIGYTLGYKVWKSYYENSTDKKKAIYTLLNTDDFEDIFHNSEFRYILD